MRDRHTAVSLERAHAHWLGEGRLCPLRTACVRDGALQQAWGALPGPSSSPERQGARERPSVSFPASPPCRCFSTSSRRNRVRALGTRAGCFVMGVVGAGPSLGLPRDRRGRAAARGPGLVKAGVAPAPPAPASRRLRPAPRCLVSLVKFPFSLFADPAGFIFP